MGRRQHEEDVSTPADEVRCLVVREFSHYPDGVKRQDEAIGGEISVPREVAERWVKAGLVELL